MTDKEPSPFTTNELERELLELEAELVLLNRRRIDVYQRSLKAAEEEKACADMVANAMLAGPLAPHNEINWPIEVTGVAWEEGSTLIHRMQERGWVELRLHSQTEYGYLGLHLANVATAVQARFGSDKLLHLSHAGHISAFWCPALSRLVLPSEAEVRLLETADDLTNLYGPEHSHPWHALAWDDLSASQEEADESPAEG